jgi:hypothetical protein
VLVERTPTIGSSPRAADPPDYRAIAFDTEQWSSPILDEYRGCLKGGAVPAMSACGVMTRDRNRGPPPGVESLMAGRKVSALASGAAAVALTLAACGESDKDDAAGEAAIRAPTSTRAEGAPRKRPKGIVEDCSTRSEASFPGAFSAADNVVVGPFVLDGAAYTAPETVREFGGDKFPALVRAGHQVTVALPRRTRRVAGLGYGPLPEGVELSPGDGHRVVTFIACRRGEPSGSTADGEPITFWSGFVLAASPRCVPLEVWVDHEPSPRYTALPMGVSRCP